MTNRARITNSAEFKTQVLDQDYADYKRDLTRTYLKIA